MMKSSTLWTWIGRLVLTCIFLGIVLLNVKVLSNKSLFGDDSTTNNQLTLSPKTNEERTLKQPITYTDESTLLGIMNNTAKLSTMTKPTYDFVKLKPPISQPGNCRLPHCREYLHKSELIAMDKCSAETSKRTVNGKIQNEHKSNLKKNNCSFINSSHRLPVALASTSGSGNTWIRGLLEKATGICTGFLYCDYAMRREGFIGENIKSGSVLVVKTHTITPKWYGIKQPYNNMADPYYGSAIYILRNPYKSMIAEWNRKVTYDILKLPHNESHTNIIQEQFWRTPEWDEFLQSYMGKWKTRLQNWVLDSPKQAVHVVRYEDLQHDVPGEVAKMLTFLKISFNKEELPIRLNDDFTMFKRKHGTNDNFEHFSSSQAEFIRRTLVDTIKLTQEANKSNILRIEDYLPS